jgi:hypothetical protein
MADYRLGFFALGQFFIYGFNTQVFEQKANVLVYDVGKWVEAPSTFNGEKGCKTP